MYGVDSGLHERPSVNWEVIDWLASQTIRNWMAKNVRAFSKIRTVSEENIGAVISIPRWAA